MIAALIVLSLVAHAPQKPPEQKPSELTSVRAYVYTEVAAAGSPTDDEQQRLAGVRDMKEALHKKKGISLVDDRDAATLVIEVTGREQKSDAQGPFGGKSITSLGDTLIRLHISSGDHESDLKGMGQGTFSRAANDAADRILKWIARYEPDRRH